MSEDRLITDSKLIGQGKGHWGAGLGSSVDIKDSGNSHIVVGGEYAETGRVLVWYGAGSSWSFLQICNPESYRGISSVAISEDCQIITMGTAARRGDPAVDERVQRFSWFSDWHIYLPRGSPIKSNQYCDGFGQSIDIDYNGDTMVVGAHLGSVSGSQGVAYVYSWQGNRIDGDWSSGVSLIHPSTINTWGFGMSVSIDAAGDTIAVAGRGDGTGYASVFESSQGEWLRISSLTPYDRPLDENMFKVRMSESGNTILLSSSPNNGDIIYEFNQMDNDRILKFNSDGVTQGTNPMLNTWGPPDPVLDHYIWGAAAGSGGSLYLSCRVNGDSSIRKSDADGNLLSHFGTDVAGFGWPRGIDLDLDSNVYVSDSESNLLWKFDSNGNLIRVFSGPNGDEENGFLSPMDVAVDSEGNFYVADTGNDRILKYNSDGLLVPGGTLEISNPLGVALYEDDCIYVVNGTHLFKFSQYTEAPLESLTQSEDFDRDADGRNSVDETSPWFITFTNESGTFSLEVTSDPLFLDTDLDDLNDTQEYAVTHTNPRSPDTDSDSICDSVELDLGTDPCHYDSDLDFLPDGVELSFGSSPILFDSDFDGLSDYTEFQLGTDPTSIDSDSDGMNDTIEVQLGTNPLSPDSDGDSMFDGAENEAGTNPLNGDSDGDNLSDLFEVFINTDPLCNDTDHDNATDDLEVYLGMNPLSNDTDGDGIGDFTELELGSNPWSNDTDYDGVPDSIDPDSYSDIAEQVVIVFDASAPEATLEFAQNLAMHTDVIIVTLEDFLANHTDSPYVVLIGTPESESEKVGGVIYNLLDDTGDVLADMMNPDSHEIAVRYCVWNSSQTVVMLSQAYPSDVFFVLQILRGVNVTMDNGTILLQYPTPPVVDSETDPYSFNVDAIDVVKATDSVLSISLNLPVTPTLEITTFNETTTPCPLEPETGLVGYEEALGKYLDLTLTTEELLEDVVKSLYI
ncbi:MAG: hypothetical protein E4H14_15570, partial [Candidatus Thorarchaeota archaeon]